MGLGKEKNDWQCILDSLLGVVENTGDLSQFKRLSTVERIKFCLSNNIIHGSLASFVDHLKDEGRFEKSIEISREYREKGNKSFGSDNPLEALDSYTKSILYAPNGSQELALSFGNRSAALFLKRNFKACLLDIEEALKIQSDDKFREIKLMIRKGKALLELRSKEALHTIMRASELISALKKTTGEQDKIDKFEKEVDVILKAVMSEMDKNEKKKPKKVVQLTADQYLENIKTQFSENLNLKHSSNKIEMKETVAKGRHIVASKDITAGDVLFIENPFAYVTLPDPHHTICQNCCQTEVDNPIACDNCAEGCYCCVECKVEALEKYHHLECGFGLDLMYNIGIAHLALRLGILGRRPENHEAYQRVKKLVSNLDKMKTEDIFMYALTASLLLIYLKNHTGFFAGKSEEDYHEFGATLLEHIAQLVCNGHAIVKYQTSDSKDGSLVLEEQRRIGTGIFPSSSMMNHSCDPTINASFIKTTLVVKAITNLKKGSEVFNCYGPNYRRLNKKERQNALQSQYHFTCKCKECMSPHEFLDEFNVFLCHHCSSKLNMETVTCTLCKTKFEGLRQIVADVKSSRKKVNLLLKQNQFEKALTLINTSTISLTHYVKNKNQLSMEMGNLAALALCKKGDWEQSFQVSEKFLYYVSVRYGGKSLEIGNEIVKISDMAVKVIESTNFQLHRIVPLIQRCIAYCDAALEIFDLHFGPYHHKYAGLKEKKAFLKKYS